MVLVAHHKFCEQGLYWARWTNMELRQEPYEYP